MFSDDRFEGRTRIELEKSRRSSRKVAEGGRRQPEDGGR
jgi:hypothetical protein